MTDASLPPSAAAAASSASLLAAVPSAYDQQRAANYLIFYAQHHNISLDWILEQVSHLHPQQASSAAASSSQPAPAADNAAAAAHLAHLSQSIPLIANSQGAAPASHATDPPAPTASAAAETWMHTRPMQALLRTATNSLRATLTRRAKAKSACTKLAAHKERGTLPHSLSVTISLNTGDAEVEAAALRLNRAHEQALLALLIQHREADAAKIESTIQMFVAHTTDSIMTESSTPATDPLLQSMLTPIDIATATARRAALTSHLTLTLTTLLTEHQEKSSSAEKKVQENQVERMQIDEAVANNPEENIKQIVDRTVAAALNQRHMPAAFNAPSHSAAHAHSSGAPRPHHQQIRAGPRSDAPASNRQSAPRRRLSSSSSQPGAASQAASHARSPSPRNSHTQSSSGAPPRRRTSQSKQTHRSPTPAAAAAAANPPARRRRSTTPDHARASRTPGRSTSKHSGSGRNSRPSSSKRK